MSVINYSDQLNYVGKGYIDGKMQPVATLTELANIPRSQRFIGLTVTVLDDGCNCGARDYWIKNSVTKWVLKEMPSDIKITGNDVETVNI